MNAVAQIEQPRASLIATMAARYNMEPATFAATLRATVVPPKATNEEFAAFLMVAKEYGLNPITKEIYAFPKQGGGIQPIVSVDGWANLINSHPQCDGFEFDDHLDGDKLVSVTCRIYRKDRSRPTTATEYMTECRRDTPTWKQWPRRMLRHKALIQAARYAFGFAGIVDPDEAERFTTAPTARDITPQRPEPPKPPIPPPSGQIEAPKPPQPDIIDAETGEVIDERQIVPETGEETATLFDDEPLSDTAFFEKLEEDLAVVSDLATLEEVWTAADPLARFDGKPAGEINQGIAMAIRKRAEKRIGGA